MISRLFYFLFLISLSSCSSKKVPADIIQPKEMKAVMWDALRADALAKQYVKGDSSLNDSAQTKILTQKVFKLHNIKAEDFNKSYAWYIKNPGIMKTMFDSLYEQKQRSNNEIKMPQHQIPKDSVPVKNIFFKKNRTNLWAVDSLMNFRK
jgi:hypothetical protein